MPVQPAAIPGQFPQAGPASRAINALADHVARRLDDASLPPLVKLKLTQELLKLKKEVATATTMQKLKITGRMLAIRKELGAAKEAVDPAPVTVERQDVEFGLKASGIKTREKLNARVRGILDQVRAEGRTGAQLTDEEREALVQYSGRGGLTDNSQSEYYTPPHIAEGTWDLLAANGFTNGNVLEPSTGAGVFSATKPAGVLISGAEIDPTSSAVAQLLHPEDRITNTAFEKLALSVADNTFDAVNGNVPFGVRGKEAHWDEAHKHEKRMERYFVRRVLDKVRPGGLVTLIVPTSVIGDKSKTWARWRAELSMHAEFLGGHKMPSKTFGKQGTDIVTDIIVLRKHPAELLDKVDKISVEQLQATNVLWSEFIDGRYWQGEGKRFIHGQFVPKDPTKARDEDRVIAPDDLTDAAMKQKLAVHFPSRIDWDALGAIQVLPRAYAEGDRKVINGQQMELRCGQWVPFTPTTVEETVLDPKVYGVDSLAQLESLLTTSEGILGLTADQAFKAWKKYPHLFNGTQAQAVKFAMSQPADKFRDVAYRGSLLGSMVSKYAIGTDAIDRDRVIGLLQAEMAKYGHPTGIKGMVLDGAKAQAFGVYLGAIDSEGKVSAAVRGEVEGVKGYESGNILSIVAYLSRMSGDSIELADIAALYDGPRQIKALGDIGDVTGIAISANGDIMTTGAYCCGDVYAKVSDLQNAMAGATDERLKTHWSGLIDLMLSKVAHTEVSAIGFGLRDNWIAAKYKLEFLRINGFQVSYVEDAADAEADASGEAPAISRNGGAWVYRGKDEFSKQLCHYLAGMSIGHNLRDRSDATASERKAEYQAKVQGLEEQFKFFMQSHADGIDLAATYDMTFNRHVMPEYDRSDLGLTGVAKGVRLHWYQNAGVRRLSDEGSGILGYDVGLGKTYSALAFSAYDRQMGRSKKHCIVVPKSVLANWYMESKAMLGSHQGVLFVGFEPKRDKAGAIVQEVVRDENNQPKKNAITGEVEYQDVLVEDSSAEVFAKMHGIPAMDGGLVIMTYEKFKIIPIKPETVAAYGDKWVDRSMASAASAAKLAGKDVKAGSYAAKKQQAGLENTFYEEGTKKKEELPYFEDMGFDRVVVDEAHNFKASFQVKEGMDKLAYLPNPAESQRAQDMALKLSHIRDTNGGKGSILLTATPVSNSPIEIYNVLMHVIPPEELDKLGIFTPADFVRFFGRIEQVQKLLITGEMGDRDGLKGFRNLNILRGLFNRYANMMGAKDVDPEGNVLKLPDAQEVKSQCEMTGDQISAYVELRAEAKKAGNPKNVASGEARPMFAVLRDMDRVTTDIDLYTKSMTFLFRTEEVERVRAMIADLPATVVREMVDEDTDEKVKVNVPKQSGFSTEGDTITYVAPDVYEYAITSRLKKFKIGYASHPLTPKYKELVKNLKAELAIGGKQLVFTEEKSQHGKLERLLVENIPKDEARIGIINADTAGGEKLQEIVDAYTRGDFDIIICNKKAEVGVNLNKGTTAVHHMTLPWTPAGIQQRNGRAVRQGNKVAAVRIYYYQSKGSFDEYRLDLLSKKASWIGALLSKDNTDDEHDNENANSDIEQAALLSDNREQFLAALAEQQAKKDAAAKERKEAAAKVSLGQLSAAREFLATFEARKAKAVAEVQSDLDKARQSLRKAMDFPVDDPVEAERTVKRREANVRAWKNRAAKVGPEMDAKRSDAEARSRQVSSTLRAMATRGELPFSARLIDAPEESLVTLNKVVVCKGAIYEIDGPDGKDILRVAGVNRGAREVDVEYLATALSGYRAAKDGTYDVDKVIGPYGREVHFDDSEIQLLRLTKEPIEYGNLADRVTKDQFLANAKRIKFADYVLVRSADGVLSAAWGASAEGVVYPDRQDRALQKEVAALYAALLGGGTYSEFTRGQRNIMPAIFGADWSTAVDEFVKRASPEAIREKAVSVIRANIGTVQTTVDQCMAAVAFLEACTNVYYGSSSEGMKQVRAWVASEGFANGRDVDIGFQQACRVEINAVRERSRELDRQEKEKAERERQAANASDPRFREMQDSQSARFAKIGIMAWYSNGDAVPGWPEFSLLALKDSRGTSGILYRVKEMMKPRFRAKFISAKSVGYGARYADCWGIPSGTDVEAFLSFLEE